jgi:protein TonB
MEFYPPSDKRNGLEAAVLVSVKVSENGCAEQLAIAGSSGTETIDDAAIRYAEALKFLPAAQGNTPTAGQMTFRVKFQLMD